MSHRTHEVHGKTRELVVFRQEVSADVTVVAVRPDEDCAVGRGPVFKDGPDNSAVFAFLYRREPFAFLYDKTICEDVSEFLSVQTKSSLHRWNLITRFTSQNSVIVVVCIISSLVLD